MRILFLSRWLPYPADNGAKIRIFNLLKQLGSHHEIDLVTFNESGPRAFAAGASELRNVCASVQAVTYGSFRPFSLRSIAGALSPVPRSLIDTYRTEVSNCVGRVVRDRRPDIVIASEIDMVPYALEVNGTPRLLEELEISRLRDPSPHHRTPGQRVRSSITWLKLSGYLRSVLPRFAACTVVSTHEAALLRSVVPHYTQIEVLPNAVDLSTYVGQSGQVQPNSIVFSGSLTYSPNQDAAQFFLSEVFPCIAERIPDAHFRITGNAPDEARRTLALRPGVEFTGNVPDVRPLVASSSVAVVPIRSGGGTRLKILEAMALGTPVVSTTKGAEGLDVQHDHNILLADDPQEFAERVLSVLQSAALRNRLATNGRQLIASTYDWAIVGHQARTLVERLVAEPVPVR